MEFGQAFPWLLVRAPTNASAVAAYEALVDAGEAAAIALAAELTCEVILDDLQARRLAARQGVRCVGLLGVLLRAKQAGQLAAVRPLIDALRAQNFHVSAPLVAEALRLAGSSGERQHGQRQAVNRVSFRSAYFAASFSRFATMSYSATSPTLRCSFNSSPTSLPLYSTRISWS